MKKVSIFVLFLILIVFLSGCAVPQSSCAADTVPEPIKIQTSDNWSYISLNLEGSVEENVAQIANAVYQWEQANPDRKIVSFIPIYRNSSYGYSYIDRVDGLSIYSEFKLH